MQSRETVYEEAVQAPSRRWYPYMILMKRPGQTSNETFVSGNETFDCRFVEINEGICDSRKMQIGIIGSREMVLELFYPGGVPEGLEGSFIRFDQALFGSDNRLHSISGPMHIERVNLINNNTVRLYCYDKLSLLKKIAFTPGTLKTSGTVNLDTLVKQIMTCVNSIGIGLNMTQLRNSFMSYLDISTVSVAIPPGNWEDYTAYDLLEAISGVLGGFITIDREMGYPTFKRFLETNYKIPTEMIYIDGLNKLEDEAVTVQFSAVPYTYETTRTSETANNEFPTEYPVANYNYNIVNHYGAVPPGLVPPWLYRYGVYSLTGELTECPNWAVSKKYVYGDSGWEEQKLYMYTYFVEPLAEASYFHFNSTIVFNTGVSVYAPAPDVKNEGLVNTYKYYHLDYNDYIYYSTNGLPSNASAGDIAYVLVATNYADLWKVVSNHPPAEYASYEDYLTAVKNYRSKTNMSLPSVQSPDVFIRQKYDEYVESGGVLGGLCPGYIPDGYMWIITTGTEPAETFPGSVTRLYLHILRGVLDYDTEATLLTSEYPRSIAASEDDDSTTIVFNCSGSIGEETGTYKVQTYYMDLNWNDMKSPIEWQVSSSSLEETFSVLKKNIIACSQNVYSPSGELLIPHYALDFWTSDEPLTVVETVHTRTFGYEYTNFLISDDNVDFINENCMPPAITYMPVNLKWRGDPRIDCGDILTVYDRKGNALTVPVMEQNLSFRGGLSASISAFYDNEKAEEYVE